MLITDSRVGYAIVRNYSTCPPRFWYIPPALYLKIVLQNILRMGPTADVHLAGGHTKDNPTKIHFSKMNRLLKNLATIHTTYKKQELDILQNKCIFTHIIMGSTWYVCSKSMFYEVLLHFVQFRLHKQIFASLNLTFTYSIKILAYRVSHSKLCKVN